MASSKDYLDFILEQLSELDDITYRAMMGEYIIYYRGKVVGGIYDPKGFSRSFGWRVCNDHLINSIINQGECKNGIEQRLFGFHFRSAFRAG